jgi:mannose/cellobiose epimerase-like protein (N-acyl-D-glucosamine 2-epimerase family)
VLYDWLGTPAGLKDLNSVVDVIKMLADLEVAGFSHGVRYRLEWYVRLVSERLIGVTGLMPDYYAPDWTPVPDVIRAGQGFQFVAVLAQAFEVLGRAAEGRAVAARLARSYAEQFVHADGGFVFARSLVRYPIRGFDMAVPERPWWVQLEACHGFLDLARRGIDRDEFVGRFATAWSQIESTLLDRVHGGFYESIEQGVGARGVGSGPAPGMKAGIWKDPSHEVNFLLDALHWLEEWRE